MKYVASLFVSLMLFWLFLSGHYTVLITSFGVLSCLFVCWLSLRMHLVDEESQPLNMYWRLPGFWLWLIGEMAKSNLNVVKLILKGRHAIEPALITVPVERKAPLFQALFANSITLTPGTVSVRVQDNVIDVHALDRAEAEQLESSEMSQRILKMNEKAPNKPAGGKTS